MTGYPEPGRCGACGRPAQRFPSKRWEHRGRPCRLRNGITAGPLEVPLPPCVFVPDGQELPTCPQRPWPMAVAERGADGFPMALGFVPPQKVTAWWVEVRAELAAEADAEVVA